MKLTRDFLSARRRRLAARDLRALSSEQLRDIGIEPGRIDAVASDMAAGREAAGTTRKPPAPTSDRLFDAVGFTSRQCCA